MFRKHEDKHKKPYLCAVPGCRHPRFGDKGGLDRHKREVHGSKIYRCPITSCKGNTKGFARKYNLFEHQKRCHPGLPIRTSRQSAVVEREGLEEAQDRDVEASSPDTMGVGDVPASGSRRLHEKIRALEALRIEIDRDIETLKRTVDILEVS